LGNGWDAVVKVSWDSPPDKGNETVLKGVLLPGADSTETSVDSLYAHVLILEQHQQHYERIGITRLPATFGKRDHPPRFFGLRDKFGNVYFGLPYQKIEQRLTIAREDVPSDLMSKYWWWKYFEPETIILV
jgi:hypothetical protein